MLIGYDKGGRSGQEVQIKDIFNFLSEILHFMTTCALSSISDLLTVD